LIPNDTDALLNRHAAELWQSIVTNQRILLWRSVLADFWNPESEIDEMKKLVKL
jgi:hypothetical protein